MKRINNRMMLVLVVLLLAAMACSLPARQSSPPPSPVPLSTEEIQQFEENVQATLAAPDTGEITLTVTEQQINSYIAAELAAQEEQVFTDPQVDLTNGQMILYGKATQGGFQVDTKVVMVPRIDENGDPKLDVESIELGPFPVPDALKSQVSDMVDDSLKDYVDATTDHFQVTNISIGEEEMTVTGNKQP